MKKSPQETFLNTNLQASKFSADGFLGTDDRSFDEIITADMQTLENIGRTVEEVVQRLKDAYERTRAELGAEIELFPGVVGVFHESMGRIPSPFRGDGVFEKGDAEITDKTTGQRLIITKLGIALIERHHFFQGLGSRYRIDPESVFQILNADAPD